MQIPYRDIRRFKGKKSIQNYHENQVKELLI